ncbi:MAG: ATP-binding protein [Elusimicrobiota bacterium]
MNENILKQVIIEQKELLKEPEQYVKREVLKEVPGLIDLKHILVITGHRRSGKSVLLSQIINGFYGKDNVFYINFDDERIAGLNVKDLNRVIEIQISLFGNKKTVFLDEIQNIAGWESFVARLFNEGYKIFITGSNAKLLSSELSTLLTGRHMDIDVYPFSFLEYLKYKGVKYEEKMLYKTADRAKLKKYFEKYLHLGGFPEAVQNDRLDILRSLFTDVITKDVIRRYNIRNVKTMEEIARFLLSNAANEFSYNRIKNVYNLGSVHTAKNYTQYLESTFMFSELPRFSHSVKDTHSKVKKIYVIDNGLMEAVGYSSSQDIGRMYENLVFMELKRRKKEIYYYKDNAGKEVDFIIREGRKVKECIQVCFNIDDIKTQKRETSSLIRAMEKFNLAEGKIITCEKEDAVNEKGKNIKIIPLWKWLLEEDR